MLSTLLYYIRLGGVKILAGLVVLIFVIILGKIIFYLAQRFIWQQVNAGDSLKVFLKGSLFLAVILSGFFLFAGIAMERIDRGDRIERTSYISTQLMLADEKIFGVYLPFWMQSQKSSRTPFFSKLIPVAILAYKNLVPMIGIFLLIFLIFDARRFYEAILVFSLSLTIGLFFWYQFPALRPLDAYLDNITKMKIEESIQIAVADYAPAPQLVEFINNMREIRPRGNYYDLTNMPSMHVAWAFMVLFFSIEMSWWFAVVSMPYFFFNAIGAIIALQHYGVDALAGILVALIAILLAKKISKHGIPRPLVAMTESIQQDFRSYSKGFLITSRFGDL